MIIVMRIHLYILQAFDLGGYIRYVIRQRTRNEYALYNLLMQHTMI